MRVNPNTGAQCPWPLLTLPGTLCDSRVFAPLLAASGLAGAFPADRICHGDMTGSADSRQLALRLLESAPARFIPLAFSLGIIVALEMALIAPERIAGMILLAGNARDVPTHAHAARRAAARRDPVQLVSVDLWDRYVAPARVGDDGLKETIAQMARAAPPQTLALQTELAITRSDKRPLLGAMTMPALVLGGDWDVIAPAALQVELAAGLPNATLKMAPQAGHFLPLECPDFCADAIADWLAQHPTLL